MASTFIGLKVSILPYKEVLHQKALRIIIRADGVLKRAGRNETTLRNVTLTQDELASIGCYLIGVAVKIAVDRVNLYTLVDISRDGSIVVAFFCQVFVVVECGLVTEQKGSLHIPFDGSLVGCNRKEEFMKASDMFTCLDGTIHCRILTESQNKRFTFVQNIDLLPLLRGKRVGGIERITADSNAEQYKKQGIKPYLLE